MNRYTSRGFFAVLGFLVAAPALAHRPPMIYAAASLTSVLQEVLQTLAPEQSLKARLSFASSSTLARQIAEGAPADLFFSASVEWMEYLEQRGLIAEGTRVDLLGNALVLIAPRGKAFAVEFRQEFDFPGAFEGRLAVADPAHVPAGRYARQALEWLGWWAGLERRLAPAPDARAALAYVERGECLAGIAYATDAAASQRVEILGRFPSESHDLIAYSLAAIQGRDTPEVRRLLAFLQSAPVARLFARHGFILQPSARAAPDSLPEAQGD